MIASPFETTATRSPQGEAIFVNPLDFLILRSGPTGPGFARPENKLRPRLEGEEIHEVPYAITLGP